jgi:hypothetical protein
MAWGWTLPSSHPPSPPQPPPNKSPRRHIVDDPSWPQASTTYPNFTRGAYASAAVYSPEDQAHIRQYAWERGVVILFELDVPGHCAAWGAGNPSYVVACDGHQTLINPVGEIGEPGTIYEVLANLMTEFQGRIGSPTFPWVHLGGDEVTDYTCWLADPSVRAWASGQGLDPDDPGAIRSAFTWRIQEVARGVGLRPMMWEESFRGAYNVSASTIITPWVTPSVIASATAAGHDVVAYVGYYLDQWVPPAQTDGWYAASVDYAYVDSLNLFYTFEPVTNVTGPGRVLGGVASAWGDNVDSALGATTMLYPRGLAIGEKLWSPQSFTAVTDPTSPLLDDVQTRLEHARCKLVQRGIGASPVGVAGVYGLCWRPEWGGVPAATPSPAAAGADSITVTSGGVAGIVVGSAAAGALLLLLALNMGLALRAAGAVGSGSKAKWGVGGSAAESLLNPLAADSVGAEKGGAGTTAFPSSSNTRTAVAPPSSSSSSPQRVVALDQLRGTTMVAMLFVNLYYGYSMLPPFFSHGITYFSGPDLIEPCFHFCVGFALRLVLLKRLGGRAQEQQEVGLSGLLSLVRSWDGFWAPRLRIFWPLFKTRVVGLILLSMFFTEGWGQFPSWSALTGFGDWIGQLVQDNQPYHTLLHIALITVWTFLAMTLGWRVRAAQLLLTACIHIALHATFYFRWIRDYNLDEGGYYGFFGWAIEALAGSLVHDIVLAGDGASSTAAPAPAPASTSSASRTATGSLNAAAAEGSGSGWRADRRAPRRLALRRVLLFSLSFMLLAYLLSCLGAVAPLTKCYDGTRIFFWGGFGADADCSGVPTYGGGFLVAPPFYLPDPRTNVVTMWTMTQRAGSATYHIFAAGTSALLFALFYALCEIGAPAPRWWAGRVASLGKAVLGVHAVPAVGTEGVGDGDGDGEEEEGEEDGGVGPREWGARTSGGGRRRLLLRWHVAEVMGENALAVYLIGDSVSNNVGNMLPQDSPAWYFLLWGEALYLGVAYVAASYLRAHKLFLRL